MSEQRIDSAAKAATTDHPDPGEGQGLAAPVTPPVATTGEVDQDEQEPATEGARELEETVRSIHRLEESN